ncbi:DUF6197 family protein [Streptomyces marispadix]|uniref:Uncharacterized protein n=1 Tax=Streptomyces marispadix TaxID=2922868 RepID=A0ABS9T0G2_9ACTN|nr:hypothetical protein [Streptomyces marispadix]MCH6162018.1 hypothetical protein [Streptomyces marispadix]
MTMFTTHTASRSPADVDESAALLVGEIERYLAARARATTPPTAHRLVTKSTQQLVDEALGALKRPEPAPQLDGPARILRVLPDRALKALRRRSRPVSVAEHLELTALVIKSYGWSHGTLRSRSGRRCIAGAQTVLHHLGYGDKNTIAAAGRALNAVLNERGQRGPYYEWNDRPGRRRDEVLDLLRTAASTAGRSR